MIERAAVVLVAVAAIAFLGAGLTAARAEDELFDSGFRKPDVTRAERLGQDRRAGHAGRPAPAAARAASSSAPGTGRAPPRWPATAVRREPENAEAWLLLSRTAQGEEARRAAERLRQLVPPVDDA